MFNRVGDKIRTLAQIICIISMVLVVVWGLSLMADGAIFEAVIIMAIGIIVSWLGALVLFGFGQLISNSDDMVELLKMMNEKNIVNSNKESNE